MFTQPEVVCYQWHREYQWCLLPCTMYL